MGTGTQKQSLRNPLKTLNVGQVIRNSVGFVAFSPTLQGRLLQRQARQVLETLFPTLSVINYTFSKKRRR